MPYSLRSMVSIKIKTHMAMGWLTNRFSLMFPSFPIWIMNLVLFSMKMTSGIELTRPIPNNCWLVCGMVYFRLQRTDDTAENDHSLSPTPDSRISRYLYIHCIAINTLDRTVVIRSLINIWVGLVSKMFIFLMVEIAYISHKNWILSYWERRRHDLLMSKVLRWLAYIVTLLSVG